jgi:hypothetical protein
VPVPAPIAMPTSVRARAGESLIPSPTMATFRPRAPELSDFLVLVGEQASAKTSSMFSSAPTGCGDLAGVAGDHGDL